MRQYQASRRCASLRKHLSSDRRDDQKQHCLRHRIHASTGRIVRTACCPLLGRPIFVWQFGWGCAWLGIGPPCLPFRCPHARTRRRCAVARRQSVRSYQQLGWLPMSTAAPCCSSGPACCEIGRTRGHSCRSYTPPGAGLLLFQRRRRTAMTSCIHLHKPLGCTLGMLLFWT